MRLKGALSKVCRSSLPLCLQHPPSKQPILITLSFVWFQVLYKLLRNCLVRRSCLHMSWKVVARERNVPMSLRRDHHLHPKSVLRSSLFKQLKEHMLKQQNLNPTCNMLPSLHKYAYANMVWYKYCDTSLRRAESTAR